MSTRIFKLWLVKSVVDVATMPQERIDEYFQKNAQIKNNLGVRDMLYGRIWSDENLTHYGVELYPDWKAVREHNRCMEELHFYQYLRSDIFLGVDTEENQNLLQPVDLATATEGITQIWLANPLPAFYDATDAEKAEAMKTFEIQRSLGVHALVNVRTRYIDERWDSWGVELYPNMEALLEKARAQEKANWWKFLQARTFLGTIESGELVKQP